MLATLPFTLPALRNAYAGGARPADIVAEAFRRLEAVNDSGIFIHTDQDKALEAAKALGDKPDGRPLWGIPFAVKDNIDVAGMPTTAACPDFTYMAKSDAFVVAKLKEAGAICLGKTNLDQFATGLVGVRSPYPVPKNAVDPAIVPGGSSSGSGVVVGHGIVCFALGTDTAGSGRVPAALNNIIGLKPSLGALSASGVVPACRTLDTISIFALTVADAWEAFAAAAEYDAADAYARRLPKPLLSALPPRPRIGIPDADSLVTCGDAVQAEDFRTTIARLKDKGAEIVELDFEPFYAVARMLYEGAWLAERVAAVGDRLTDAAETMHPTTRAILTPGLEMSAVDAFNGIYRLQELRRICEGLLSGLDGLCVPTIPCFVSLAEIAADPIGPNSRLGTYTNFVNLLDMCGIAVPTGPRPDGRPGSVTFLSGAGRDGFCAALAASVEDGALGATGWQRPDAGLPLHEIGPDELPIAVCGAHMSGLPLNGELTRLGARFIKACNSAPIYRFYALAGGPPFRPGMVRQETGGEAVALEVWALPKSAYGTFLADIPAPLGIGQVTLEDGSSVPGFLCEAAAIITARDISHFGGWRAFLAAEGTKNLAKTA